MVLWLLPYLLHERKREGSMSEASYTAEALELLFTSATPGWFSPFETATESLTAQQAATVPAPRFNSVWAVVNHVRYWQEAALLQLQQLPVDGTALGSEDGSGWPPAAAPVMKSPGLRRGSALWRRMRRWPSLSPACRTASWTIRLRKALSGIRDGTLSTA